LMTAASVTSADVALHVLDSGLVLHVRIRPDRAEKWMMVAQPDPFQGGELHAGESTSRAGPPGFFASVL
jgi:hypothetical protein